MKFHSLSRPTAVLAAVAVAGLVAATASGRSTAVPAQTSSPTLQGHSSQPFVGDKLTTSNGSWSGSPTKYTYQWERCDAAGDRVNCALIPGATSQSYTVSSADENHTLKADVFATNKDGTGKADTKGSGVVSPRGAPKNTSRPTITGTPVVGQTLSANNGTWTGVGTFSYQWQLCDANGNNCTDIVGATGSTYGVRATDTGHEILVRVKASNRFGSTTADSDRTVPATVSVQTTTTVVTVSGNRAPSIAFLSLKRVGYRLYARFRTCDDKSSRIRITERDTKTRVIAKTRHFTVGCGTYRRSWVLLKPFRSHGRIVVSLRASDSAGKLSRIVSRSVRIR